MEACGEINFKNINYPEISYYSLQGNYKKVSEFVNGFKVEYYKNYALGYSYLIGKNRLKDYDLAREYLLKSAQYCFSPAHYSLGYLYYIEGDVEEAKKWFISAKDLGDNLAAHQLGIIYKKEGDSEKMLDSLHFAETNDFTPSITELGVQYYDGFLVNRDLHRAFKYFEKASLRNDPLAQNNLGWMYEYGEGTEKNIEKAEYWYRIASENGFSLATENLKRLQSIIIKNKVVSNINVF